MRRTSRRVSRSGRRSGDHIVLAGQFFDGHARLVLLDNPYDLLFGIAFFFMFISMFVAYSAGRFHFLNVIVFGNQPSGTAKRLWRWMKRRAAIDPGIRNLKREHRMDRCQLKGNDGDQLNAILSAAGMNFGKLLKAASRLPLPMRMSFAYLIDLHETTLRPLRLKMQRPDQPDLIMGLA